MAQQDRGESPVMDGAEEASTFDKEYGRLDLLRPVVEGRSAELLLEAARQALAEASAADLVRLGGLQASRTHVSKRGDDAHYPLGALNAGSPRSERYASPESDPLLLTITLRLAPGEEGLVREVIDESRRAVITAERGAAQVARRALEEERARIDERIAALDQKVQG